MRLQALGFDFHHRLPSTEYNGAHVMALASTATSFTPAYPGRFSPRREASGTAPDGRILVLVQAEQAPAPPITLVMNRDAELKK